MNVIDYLGMEQMRKNLPIFKAGDTLRVHVYRLRKKLETGPSSWRYVTTERGVGYRFVSAV